METLKALVAAPLGIAFMVGGPVTYIILVVDTWKGGGSVLWNTLINLTLDIFLAAIWPITWLLWFLWEAMGWGSPLSRVLGIF